MKTITTVIVLAISFAAVSASAQTLNTNVSGKVDVNVGSDSSVKAETKTEAKSQNSEDKGNAVSARASAIRGLSENDKKEFLTTVKVHSQLKSEQDLDMFAKGVMIKDENVSAVTASENNVEVRYKLPAKFLGVFGTELGAVTKVTFETEKTGRGPKEVSVKFPWYRMFFSLSTSTREAVLQEAIDARVQIDAQYPRDNTHAQNGATVNIISSVLKSLRAKVEASAEAKTQVN
jgi:hypothetical protein